MVNIFYYTQENSNEKKYFVKNIDIINAYQWLHNNCESIGADGFYFKGKKCFFENIK